MTAIKFDDTLTGIAVRMAAEARALLHPCAHDDICVRRTAGGYPDDITNEYGDCRAAGCGLWVVRETNLSLNTVETRVMTEQELDRLQDVEDRYRRSDSE